MTRDPLFSYLARPSRRRLAKVIATHYRHVWKLALRITGNEDDASDVTQDVFLGLHLGPPASEEVTSPRGYLSWRVVDRISRLRRAHARRRQREEEHARRVALGVADTSDTDSVREALESLADEDRMVLELRYLAGLSTAEVAAILGVGGRAARLRLEKARGRLRERLSPFFAGGVFAGFPSDVAAAPAVPPEFLLERLLHAADVASALAPVTATAKTTATATTLSPLQLGGVLVSTKKIISTAVIAVVLVGSAALLLVQRGRNDDVLGPVSAKDQNIGLTDAAASSSESSPAPDQRTDSRLDGAGSVPLLETPPASIAGTVTAGGLKPVGAAEVWALDTSLWTAVAEERRAQGLIYPRDPEGELEALRSRYAELLRRAPRVRTDDSGRYVFQKLSFSTYRIVVLARGFLPHAETLVDYAGRTARAHIAMACGGTISGRVVDSTGAPVARASLRWRESSRPPAVGSQLLAESVRRWETGLFVLEAKTILSGPDGSFEIAFLAPASYDLEARSPGHLPANAWAVRAPAEDVELVLESGARIVGRLVDEGGASIAGGKVEAIASRIREVHRLFDLRVDVHPFGEVDHLEAAAGSDGRFRIQALSAGHWDVRARADGYAPSERSVVVADETLELGDVVLDPPRAISGEVRDRDGAPIGGARVWAARPVRSVEAANRIHNDLPGPLLETTSREDGAFRLDGLPGGAFELLAEHPSFALARVGPVSAGSDDVIILTMHPGVTLRGSVVEDESGDPVGGAMVSVRFDGQGETITDEEGRFTLAGLSLDQTFRGDMQIEVRAAGFDVEREPVSLQAHAPEQELEIRLRQVERAEGRVVDEQGEGVHGALVTFGLRDAATHVVSFDSTWGLYTFSRPDGSFSLPAPSHVRSMILGSVRPVLEAHREGLARASHEFDSLPPTGKPWPFVELVLRAGKSLRGIVRDPAGHAVAGARIVVVPQGGASPFVGVDRPISAPLASSGLDGSFELGGLAGGEAMLAVRAAGFAPAAVPVEVERGEVTVVLLEGGKLDGRVVGHDGAPIYGAEVVALPAETAEALLEKASDFTGRMSLRRSRGAAWARTGTDGRFTIADLPRASFSLVARSPGYAIAMASDLTPGAAVGDLILERFSAVSGRVLDSVSREPVREFTIDAIEIDERKSEQERHGTQDIRLGSRGVLRVRDPHGRFFYDGLSAGHYEIAIHATDHVFAKKEVTLTTGEEKKIELLVDPGGEIEVRVVYADDRAPLAGALVGAFYQSEEGDLRGSRDAILTGTDGRCRLVGLRAGRYFVRATHPYAIPEGKQSTTLEVTSGEVARITVLMRRAGRLVGRLTGLEAEREGKVRTTHRLELKRAGTDDRLGGEPASRRGNSVLSTYIDGEGTFRQNSIPPGEYRLELVSQDQEDGELVSIGPSGGYSSLEPVGPERRLVLGEVRVRAAETTRVAFDVRSD